jgi:hypothetical protein
VVCIQTFAENLRWNPHVHVLLLSGMVNQAGEFLPLSHWDLPVLSEIFRREVFSMLQSKGLLIDERLRLLYSWRHSGFHVHIGVPLRFYYGAYSNLARHRRAAMPTPEYQHYSEQQGQQGGISRKAWRRRSRPPDQQDLRRKPPGLSALRRGDESSRVDH